MLKTIFTPAELARIFQVTPRTIRKWFDSGRLRGYRIPGTDSLRIPKEYAIDFAVNYEFDSAIEILKNGNVEKTPEFMESVDVANEALSILRKLKENNRVWGEICKCPELMAEVHKFWNRMSEI